MRFLILLSGIITTLSTVTFAQEIFDGKITYTIELEGDPNGLKALKKVNPDQMVLHYGDEKLCIEFYRGVAQIPRQVVIIDGTKEELYNIDHSDHTIIVFNDVERDESIERSIQPEAEILNILGYDCQKYKYVEQEDGVQTTTYFWITPDLVPKNKYLSHSSIKRLDAAAIEGLILKEAVEFEFDSKTYVQTTSAVELIQEKPASSLFDWQILDYMIMDDRFDEE
ncbi:MAG: hypothetical protein AAFV80_08525 [Bacteroidota bacterium]